MEFQTILSAKDHGQPMDLNYILDQSKLYVEGSLLVGLALFYYWTNNYMPPLVLLLGSAGFVAGLVKVIREAILISRNEPKPGESAVDHHSAVI